MEPPQLSIDQEASFDPKRTFFQLDNLQQLQFKDCHEMDTFFTKKATLEGFKIIRRTGQSQNTQTYMCSLHPVRNKETLQSKSSNCTFKFSFSFNSETHTFNLSKNAKNNFLHNHEAHHEISKLIPEEQKNLIQNMRYANIKPKQISMFFSQTPGITLSRHDVKSLVVPKSIISLDQQINQFKENKETNGEFYSIRYEDESFCSLLSLFHSSQKEEDIELIIFDETKFPNVFHGCGICPLTIVSKNYSNEILGYILSISFNYESYKWVLLELRKIFPNLRTIVTDDTSALWALSKEHGDLHNICQVLCIWHALKKLKHIDDDFIHKVYEITHNYNPDIVVDLIQQLRNGSYSKKEQQWIDKIFGDQLEKHTIALGPTPSYGIVVSSRAESTNHQIKEYLRPMSHNSLLSIEETLKFNRDYGQANAKQKDYSSLLPVSDLIIKLKEIFSPTIIYKFLYREFQNTGLLTIVEESADSITFINESEKVKFNKDYPYVVRIGPQNKVSCSCAYAKALQLPCCHVIKFCALREIPVDISFCSYWKHNEEKSFNVSVQELEEMFLLGSRIHLQTKMKSLVSKFENLSRSNEKYSHNINELCTRIVDAAKKSDCFNDLQKFVQLLYELKSIYNTTFNIRGDEPSCIKRFESPPENEEFVKIELLSMKITMLNHPEKFEVFKTECLKLISKLDHKPIEQEEYELSTEKLEEQRHQIMQKYSAYIQYNQQVQTSRMSDEKKKKLITTAMMNLQIDIERFQHNLERNQKAKTPKIDANVVAMNSYFYRNCLPNEQFKTNKWTSEEKQQFLKVLKKYKDQNEPIKWGIFSIDIPGRVGYQCANFYRQLIKDGEISDPRYKISDDGKHIFGP